MIGLFTRPPRRIAVLGAHCDDIAIGMGATLLALTGADPEVEVRALVLSGGGTGREVEERAALTAFCSGTEPQLHVLDVPDGRAPAHWDRIKNALADLKTHGSRFGDRAQAGGLRVALGDLGFPGGRGLKAGGSWEGGSSSSG